MGRPRKRKISEEISNDLETSKSSKGKSTKVSQKVTKRKINTNEEENDDFRQKAKSSKLTSLTKDIIGKSSSNDNVATKAISRNKRNVKSNVNYVDLSESDSDVENVNLKKNSHKSKSITSKHDIVNETSTEGNISAKAVSRKKRNVKPNIKNVDLSIHDPDATNDAANTHCKQNQSNFNSSCQNIKKTTTEISSKIIPRKKKSDHETSATIKSEEKDNYSDSISRMCADNLSAIKSDSNQGVLETFKSSDSSSEDEWEEVEEQAAQNIDDYNPELPKEGIEITIDCPNMNFKRRQKKEFDENEYIRLYINRIRKDVQLSVHKVNLLCLLSHGLYVNEILNSDDLKGLALSLVPVSLLISPQKISKYDINDTIKLVDWFRNFFTFQPNEDFFQNLFNKLTKCFMSHKASNASEYNLLFAITARALGLKARLCMSLYPVSHKAKNLIKKPNDKVKTKKSLENGEGSSRSKIEKPKSKPKLRKIKKNIKLEKSDNAKESSKKIKAKYQDDSKKEPLKRSRRSEEKSYKISSDESEKDVDEDYKITEDSESDAEYLSSKSTMLDWSPTIHKPIKRKSIKKNRKVLSSDSESSSIEDFSNNASSIKYWTEIYSKPDECWLPIECVNNLINKPYEIETVIVQPVTYIVAIDNNSYIKDVTRRYCSEFMTVTRKLRVCSDWWDESLEPFMPPNTKLNKDEENKLEMLLVNKPMPTTISGFKNHPLYALKRHLLKFEGIYPPDAPSLGFIRNEAVYARECVCQLHSRETWLKEARVVRAGEEPYKIVKARPKWNKIACELKTDLPLEIFGEWQTEPYQPPEAKDGKVPRNEYGNVELFKPCMLPKGTVHLQIPGLIRVARKLNIDCCAAVVGFDGHKGSVHPVFDGFIVCKEFKDTLLAAWDEDQEIARKREEEKREKRIYGNWKKLIRGLYIRERLKLKYDVK